MTTPDKGYPSSPPSSYDSVPPYGYGAPVPVGAPYSATSPNARPNAKRNKIIVIVTIVVAVLIALGVIGSAVYKALSAPASTLGVITLDGTIGSDGGANTPEGLRSLLQQAEHDPSIDAVVLRVDSGGGAAAAGEEMATYVKDFSKPIVVSTGSTNASAAYLISSQTDWIVANQASSVGAIGTVMQLIDYSGLLTTLGVEVTNIASAESKDSSYGTRPLTPEEIAYYQDLVNQINETFITSVSEGRDMPVEEVRKLATGMPFTGLDGLENGLVDEIGTFEDACNKAASLVGASSYSIQSLSNSNDWSILDLFAKTDSSVGALTKNGGTPYATQSIAQ